MSRQHDGALEEMDMLHRVDDAGDVVEILDRRFAIVAGDGIDDVHRRAGGAEIDPLAPGLHVVLRILAVQHEAAARPWRACPRPARAGKSSRPLSFSIAPGRGADLDAGGDGVGEADLLQHVEGGVVDPQHILVAERLDSGRLPAPARPGADSGQGRGPQGPARLAPAAAAGIGFEPRSCDTPSRRILIGRIVFARASGHKR